MLISSTNTVIPLTARCKPKWQWKKQLSSKKRYFLTNSIRNLIPAEVEVISWWLDQWRTSIERIYLSVLANICNKKEKSSIPHLTLQVTNNKFIVRFCRSVGIIYIMKHLCRSLFVSKQIREMCFLCEHSIWEIKIKDLRFNKLSYFTKEVLLYLNSY